MVHSFPASHLQFRNHPTVDQIDPLWASKEDMAPKLTEDYEDIHLPKNTPMGLYIGILSLIFGFAMTWHIYWLAIVSFIGIVICLIIRLSGEDEHEIITSSASERDGRRHVKEAESAMTIL